MCLMKRGESQKEIRRGENDITDHSLPLFPTRLDNLSSTISLGKELVLRRL